MNMKSSQRAPASGRVGSAVTRIGSLAAAAIWGLLVLGLCAPEPAFADCLLWDLNGRWEFWQANKIKAIFDLTQTPDGKIDGKGHYASGAVFGEDGDGTVSGTMTGNKFSFVATWGAVAGASRGEYKGEVGPNGELSGVTQDLTTPQVIGAWHEWAGRRAKCMTAQTPASTRVNPNYQPNTNMPGNDYRSFETTKAADAECSVACSNDPNCKAWTWVRPGIQAPKGKCWLKNAVPTAVANDCCISGLWSKVIKLGDKKAETQGRVLGKTKAGKALNDVDVFDSPVVPRNVVGLMRAGKSAKYLGHHPDGWTNLQGVASGGGDGWVADDHISVTGSR